MSISIAYLAVILVWSTTPLGIVWSSDSVHPTMAVLLRMVIALVLGGIIIMLYKIPFSASAKAIRVYCYSAIGIFGGMMFSYMAAGYITSGLMSLSFGSAPIVSALLGQKILNEAKFTAIKKVAMLLSFSGLAIVCMDTISLKGDMVLGLVYIAFAVFFFSISGVLVKSVQVAMHPMATTVGALAVSIPLFTITWLLMDGTIPYQQWQPRAIWAIVYLGVFGSFIGFVAYFYVLQKLSASTVALVTMITPILALSLGALLNNEPISFNILLGASIVLIGLFFYNWGDKLWQKKALA